jgi:effector-binding domain-containing protein
MISEPELKNRPEQHYAAVRMQVLIPFGDVLPSLYGEVNDWLAGKGMSPAGAPIIRYLTTDMSRKLDIEVGWPVSAPISGDSRIIPGLIPAGRYAVTTYTGPYDGLVDATAALLAWADKNNIAWKKSTVDGIEWWDARFEIYLTDPGIESDPQKWKTELVFLTK